MTAREFTLAELTECEAAYSQHRFDVHSGRWYTYYVSVFEFDDGKLYAVDCAEGLTEMQDVYGDDQYTDMADGKVTLYQVELYEEMQPVKKWRRIVAA